MHILPVRHKRFRVTNPDAQLSRRAAVELIRRHAEKVRVFEDLEGYPALMVADKSTRRLVMMAELTDEQIRAELPDAWCREHYQADLFRSANLDVANDPYHPAPATPWNGGLSLFRYICRRFLC